ncbi:MAG TPA: transposase [Steroidobacteraceae bacterium]|nr:transposase [Steroidobacteraceae bacterium]
MINRANNKARIFHDNSDYAAFTGFMAEARLRFNASLLAACLMPNHVHFVLQPNHPSDITRWMHWVFTTHVGHHHRKYGTLGRLWQGRFKASPIQRDRHLLLVMRYVERNALTAYLVGRAEDWRWGSLHWRMHGHPLLAPDASPVTLPNNWIEWVNTAQSAKELANLRASISRERPIGSEEWVLQTARDSGMMSSINPRGRPRKSENQSEGEATYSLFE